MATEKIYLNFIPNSYWEISSPVFFSKNCICNFVCKGNKWVGDCLEFSKDLYPSKYDHLKFFAAFLNDANNQKLYNFDYERITNPKFELFLRSINGFQISVEYIPGGFGFHFYPGALSFNAARNTSIGRVKFVGSNFLLAEKKIRVAYRNIETLELRYNNINLTETEFNTLKKVICSSIRLYMEKNSRFGGVFYISEEIKSKLPYFDY